MAKTGRNDPCSCGSGKKYKMCCLNKPQPESPSADKPDELAELMEKGWSLIEKKHTARGCDMWLELWDRLKPMVDPACKNIQNIEELFSGCDFIYNWCQDVESELGNAGIEDPAYYRKRIEYCVEFCTLFPESDELLLFNMKRAIAESYCALGDASAGDKNFQELTELNPENVWSYIGWGDMYLWPLNKNVKPNYERAEQIYTMALGRNLAEENHVIERLKETKKNRIQEG